MIILIRFILVYINSLLQNLFSNVRASEEDSLVSLRSTITIIYGSWFEINLLISLRLKVLCGIAIPDSSFWVIFRNLKPNLVPILVAEHIFTLFIVYAMGIVTSGTLEAFQSSGTYSFGDLESQFDVEKVYFG